VSSSTELRFGDEIALLSLPHRRLLQMEPSGELITVPERNGIGSANTFTISDLTDRPSTNPTIVAGVPFYLVAPDAIVEPLFGDGEVETADKGNDWRTLIGSGAKASGHRAAHCLGARTVADLRDQGSPDVHSYSDPSYEDSLLGASDGFPSGSGSAVDDGTRFSCLLPVAVACRVLRNGTLRCA